MPGSRKGAEYVPWNASRNTCFARSRSGGSASFGFGSRRSRKHKSTRSNRQIEKSRRLPPFDGSAIDALPVQESDVRARPDREFELLQWAQDGEPSGCVLRSRTRRTPSAATRARSQRNLRLAGEGVNSHCARGRVSTPIGRPQKSRSRSTRLVIRSHDRRRLDDLRKRTLTCSSARVSVESASTRSPPHEIDLQYSERCRWRQSDDAETVVRKVASRTAVYATSAKPLNGFRVREAHALPCSKASPRLSHPSGVRLSRSGRFHSPDTWTRREITRPISGNIQTNERGLRSTAYVSWARNTRSALGGCRRRSGQVESTRIETGIERPHPYWSFAACAGTKAPGELRDGARGSRQHVRLSARISWQSASHHCHNRVKAIDEMERYTPFARRSWHITNGSCATSV